MSMKLAIASNNAGYFSYFQEKISGFFYFTDGKILNSNKRATQYTSDFTTVESRLLPRLKLCFN